MDEKQNLEPTAAAPPESNLAKAQSVGTHKPEGLSKEEVQALLDKHVERENVWLNFAQEQAQRDREYFDRQLNQAKMIAYIFVAAIALLVIGSHYWSFDKQFEAALQDLDRQRELSRKELEDARESMRERSKQEIEIAVLEARTQAKKRLEEQLERPALQQLMQESVRVRAKEELRQFREGVKQIEADATPRFLYLGALAGSRAVFDELRKLAKVPGPVQESNRLLFEGIKQHYKVR